MNIHGVHVPPTPDEIKALTKKIIELENTRFKKFPPLPAFPKTIYGQSIYYDTTNNLNNFDRPKGVAVKGNSLYVVDFGHGTPRFSKFEFDKNYSFTFCGSFAILPPGWYNSQDWDSYSLQGIAVAQNDRVYVVMSANLDSALQAMDPVSGSTIPNQQWQLIQAASVYWPMGGVAVFGDKVYVTNLLTNGSINIYTKDLQLLTSILHRGNDPSDLRWPIGISSAQSGIISVADESFQQIKTFDECGDLLTTLGASGDFSSPCGVVETLQATYVADTGNSRIQKWVFPSSGGGYGNAPIITTLQCSFQPAAFAVDQSGYILAADTLGNRIVVYQPI